MSVAQRETDRTAARCLPDPPDLVVSLLYGVFFSPVFVSFFLSFTVSVLRSFFTPSTGWRMLLLPPVETARW